MKTCIFSAVGSRASFFVGVMGIMGISSGCIPVVAPPLRISGSFGTGTSGLPGVDPVRGRAIGRLGFSPLGFSKKHTRRVIDPELGAVFEGVLGERRGDDPDSGGYIGVGWRFVQGTFEPKSVAGYDVFLRGTADFVVREPGHGLGGGASLALGAELTGFADGYVHDANKRSGGFSGYAYGEGGIGLEIGSAVRKFEDATAWQVTFGLSVRLPALAGLLIIPTGSSNGTRVANGTGAMRRAW